MESRTTYNNELGKTLSDISEMFNIPVSVLEELNPVVGKNVLLEVRINEDYPQE